MSARPKLTGDRCMCAACGEHFVSSLAFSMHRRGDFPAGRTCATVEELRDDGWTQDKSGFWHN